MTCPYDCTPKDGNGPPRPVTVKEVRMMIHDTAEPYSISDEEIQFYIDNAMIEARAVYNIIIDAKTGWPATDLDAYFVLLLTAINLLTGYTIQIRGGGRGSGGGAAGCGGAVYNAVIDSISEGGSSISFSSMSELKDTLEKYKEQLEKLKIGRWGCAIYVSHGNY